MKKILVSISFASLIMSVVFLSSCSKEDTTAPIVTLLGDASLEISLNTLAWADPGATATDDEDGDATVTSDFSTTNPNLNLVGTYSITYSSTDAAGNVGTAVRTIRVKNDAENFAGNYSVHDTCPGLVFNYNQTITVDETLNNRVHFNKFADYANNSAIYANKLGNGTLEIPAQVGLNIGTGTGCDVSDHRFTSVSCVLNIDGFELIYDDEITTSGCTGTTRCTATYTKL